MRLQLLKFLTAGLLTLIVLSPELVVLSVVWEQHMQLVEIQHLAREINQIHADSQNTSKFPLELAAKKSVRDSDSIKIFGIKIPHSLLTSAQLYKVVDFWKWFFLLLPICLGIFFFLYDRYLVYRATIFQQQVEMLERLWHENIEQ
ncbi:MAG: hypothetical protein N2235_04625 [Fischerella sp.]|nr:hypothetical protein [Fischerella sp.]